jgi:H+-transporting ATPase
MAIGALNLARKQIIVSRLSSIEELAGVDVLCSDKTGTLTQNRMSISEPFVLEGFSTETLIFYAALASKEENRDPIEIPIFEWLKEKGVYEEVRKCKQVSFIPFDPVRKRTEAVINCGKRELVVTKGAPQVILEISSLSEEDRKTVAKKVEEFALNGFRTIGVAYRNAQEKEFHFVGLIPLFDPPREDSKEAVEKARQLGIEVKMLTGDNIAIAKYIAKLLGIGNKILSAKELRSENFNEYLILAEVLTKAIMLVEGKSEEEAREKSKAVVELVKKELKDLPLPKGIVRKHESEIIKLIEEANGFAEVFPEDKYLIVDKLQKAGHIVGMTGDGVNDAPALKKADCGIAVSNATDAARAAADIVLLKPGLSVIVKAFETAREIFGRMQAYTIYRIAETIRVVGFMGLSIIFFQFYPVTPIMIIILALLNDIPILTIAYDRTRVSEKPVRWDMYEINVMSFYLGFAGVISSFLLVFLLLNYWKLPLELVQSIVFLKLAVKGHGTLYNARIMDHLWKKPWPSPILWAATYSTRVAGTLVGVYGFGLLTPTGWGWAMFIWGYALTWLLINDFIKLFVWKMYREKRFMFAPGHFKLLRKIFST